MLQIARFDVDCNFQRNSRRLWRSQRRKSRSVPEGGADFPAAIVKKGRKERKEGRERKEGKKERERKKEEGKKERKRKEGTKKEKGSKAKNTENNYFKSFFEKKQPKNQVHLPIPKEGPQQIDQEPGEVDQEPRG